MVFEMANRRRICAASMTVSDQQNMTPSDNRRETEMIMVTQCAKQIK
jgi:hypothetical protein